MNSVRIVTIIGNRPQFVKAAAVSRLLRERHEELIVHTGQHYDDELSRVFFEELGIPAPDRELGAARGTNTEQTARILGALEPVLARAAAGARARLRGHELDARRRARRRPGRDPGRARRVGHALLRPLDARGAQPGPDRPRQRPAAVLHPDRDGQPGARGRARRDPPRRRRDGGRVGRVPRDRRRALDDRGRPGPRAGRIPGRHRSPRRQRGRPRPARTPGRA